MLAVKNMQLAVAVIEKFGFTSVCQIIVDEHKAEILLHDNVEFHKVASQFKEEPLSNGGSIVARLTAKVDGVSLLAFKCADEKSAA